MKTKKITPLKLSDVARKELERVKKETGCPFVKQIEDLLLKTNKFNPEIEAKIKKYQSQNECSREHAVEGLLTRA